ncbi:MAG: hypothetical protein O3C60_13455 [Planctomycetota bacterium]|nr:hypothetical protein [Planctomycetota bacterium]
MVQRLVRHLGTLACCVALMIGSLGTARVLAEGSTGWQAMRVIEQLGRPQIMRAADLDADGRSELIVVNSQFSRLDVYHWLSKSDRKPAEGGLRAGPNDLPMAEEFRCEEIQLEHIPHDVIVRQGKDQPLELLVLVASPNLVVSYRRQEGQWKQGERHLLPSGEFSPRHKPMLMFTPSADRHCLLVSYEEGIHVLDLTDKSRSDWLVPRETRRRADWWLADIDLDGDQDLLEFSREAKESLRWYESVSDGHLASGVVLVDSAITGATVLRRSGRLAQPLVIDGTGSELLRRHELSSGDSHPLGERHPLAVSGGRKALWSGLQIDQQTALVAVNRDRPQLLVSILGKDGWEREQSFPAVSDIMTLVAPSAQPGSLLLWAKDAPELLVSRWEEGRLSYPRPWSSDTTDKTRKVIALNSVGESVWWGQLTGKDVALWVWPKNTSQPQLTSFENLSAKVDGVLWLGGNRILFRETHVTGLKVAEVRNGKTEVLDLVHLKKASLDEFRLFATADGTRVAKLVDGALQWLDEKLHPTDQVMLPQGQKISDFVPQQANQGWALQEDGQALHRLEFDANGVAESRERLRIGGGVGLVLDPVLGMVLVGARRLIVMREGPQQELRLVDVADHRIGQAAGVKDLHIHRIDTIDVDGDGQDEIILFDDIRHQLTVLSASDEKLETRQSWPVFEDKKYPYSDSSAPVVHEPRAVVSLDFDGDRQPDMALLCHDRLLIYLAKDGTP